VFDESLLQTFGKILFEWKCKLWNSVKSNSSKYDLSGCIKKCFSVKVLQKLMKTINKQFSAYIYVVLLFIKNKYQRHVRFFFNWDWCSRFFLVESDSFRKSKTVINFLSKYLSSLCSFQENYLSSIWQGHSELYA
jgi:hypothetical protein